MINQTTDLSPVTVESHEEMTDSWWMVTFQCQVEMHMFTIQSETVDSKLCTQYGTCYITWDTLCNMERVT